MAQGFKAPAPLAEALGSVPNARMTTHSCLATPLPGDLMSSSSSGLRGYRQCTDMDGGKTLVHTHEEWTKEENRTSQRHSTIGQGTVISQA